MSAGSQSRDVPPATKSSSGFAHSRQAEVAMSKRTTYDPAVLMVENRLVVCPYEDPDILMVDGTGSMGKWSWTFHDKSDRYVGQISFQRYLEDHGFAIMVIGDANRTKYGGSPDKAPIQLTRFVNTCPDTKKLLDQVWMEGGGGGHARECYELGMYGTARKVKRTGNRKGWLTILGDEGFYPVIKGEHLRKHFGDAEAGDIPTEDIIRELKESWNVLVLHVHSGNYSREEDANILAQWRDYFGEDVIDITKDPKAIVDFMLAHKAFLGGTRSMDEFDKDLIGQEQKEPRRNMVKQCPQVIKWVPAMTGIRVER